MMLKVFKLLICVLLISSCAEEEISKGKNLNDLGSQDYEDYLKHVPKVFLSDSSIKEIKLENENRNYINKIIERLKASNETIFLNDQSVSVHIVKLDYPLVVSMPDCSIIYSNYLIEKYLKSEDLFVATLTAEFIKCNMKLFEKKTLYPLGFVSVDKLLYLSKIDIDYKQKLNEMTYVVLKRSGYDASAYLNWIQIQNRNGLEFAIYLGDKNQISKEEQGLKYFMSKQGINSLERKINESNSSKDFYEFIKLIKKGKINET